MLLKYFGKTQSCPMLKKIKFKLKQMYIFESEKL